MIKKPILIILLCCILCGCSNRIEKYQAEFGGTFDTITVIVGYASSESEFNRYANIIYERMKELTRLYDIYNEYEGINNLYTINKNAGITPVKVDKNIINMLLFARESYNITGGLVNVAMGSVLKIWHDYRTEGLLNTDEAKLPPMDELIIASKKTSIDNLIIDEEASTVYLTEAGMSLDVGAIAKGYAAELAAKEAKDAGMISALINAGGNIVSVGKPLDSVRQRWGIGIQDPNLTISGTQNIIDVVYANDVTVSCSGDYQRYYFVDGQRYNHIINPETLMPANLYKSVTVIHKDSGFADFLSTALFILPQEEGRILVEKCNAEAFWIFADDSQMATEGYVRISKNMGNYSAVDSTD